MIYENTPIFRSITVMRLTEAPIKEVQVVSLRPRSRIFDSLSRDFDIAECCVYHLGTMIHGY